MPTDDVAVGVDQHQGGPGAGSPQLPDEEVLVVHHGMFDVVSGDDASDVVGFALIGELGAVNSDDHQLVRVLQLEALQIGNDVDAVDAPVGPEVEQDDLSPQVGQLDRSCDIEPIEALRKLRSRIGPRKRSGSHRLGFHHIRIILPNDRSVGLEHNAGLRVGRRLAGARRGQ